MREFTLDLLPTVCRRERFNEMDSLVEVVSEPNKVPALEINMRGAD
jgi:hypothetical protein